MAWNSGLQIRVLEGRDQGRVFPLDAQEMTLGRALDPKEVAPGWVLFSEPTVSRVHAILQWNEGRRTFLLQHRSRTNPTLVDGKPVEQNFLQPGQRIQLGLLVFGVEVMEVRAGKLGDAVQAPPARRPSLSGPVFEALSNLAEEKAREPMAGMAGLADEAPGRGRRQGRSSPGSMRLLVAQGPDQGTSFNLREPVLVIGRRLGPNDSRSSAGVLLQDDSLPSEQALLVWQDREFTYGILQSEASPVITRIRRVVAGRPKEIQVGADLPTLLYEGDVVMMGQSSLVVRKAPPGQDLGPEDQEAEPDQEEPVSWPEVRDRGRSALVAPAVPAPPAVHKELPEPKRPARSWRNPGSAEVSSRPPTAELRPEGPGDEAARVTRTPGSELDSGEDTLTRRRSRREPESGEANQARRRPRLEPEPDQEVAPRRRPRPERDRGEEAAPRRRIRPTPGQGPDQEALHSRPSRPEPAQDRGQEAPTGRRVRPEPDVERAPEPPVVPLSVSALPAPQVPTPPAEAEAEAPTIGGIVPRGLPPHLERSLRGGKATVPPITPSPVEVASEIPLFDSQAFGGATSAWRHQSDFVVGYEEGSRKGQRVALLGPELSDDRVVTIGSPGQRINDIEVDDPEIANDQAILKYRSGRFTLVNSRSEIQVNSLTLGDGDQVVLMTGDRIHLGRTVLIFLERRVVEALRNLALEVVEGIQADLHRVFDLNKERLMIGRGRNCDIRLADPEISRVHCVLVHRNGRFFVQHRSETNPTFVNGISMLPGAERQVVVGDRIQVSSQSVLQFRSRE